MDAFHDLVQGLSKHPGAWERVQHELRAAEDPQGRLIELAREYGLSIDRADVAREVAARGRELSEDELESISGGGTPGPPNVGATPGPPDVGINPGPPNQEVLLISLLQPTLRY
jgi:bacteriocin-like protein